MKKLFAVNVKNEFIGEFMKIFQKQSPEHQLTYRRHNAIDKVIGEALYTNVGFTDKILLMSGRISSEILSKALRCPMPA